MNRANWPYTPMMNGDGMAVCGFLGIFMTRKVPDSISNVSCDSTKPTKITSEQEIIFGKALKNVIEVLKDTFK